MATNSTPQLDRFQLDELEAARGAAHLAAVWAGILGAFWVVASLITGNVLFYVPALCYGVAAWRIWRGSQPWAIMAFWYFASSKGSLPSLNCPSSGRF